MTVQTVKVTDTINLSCIRTDRFKTGILTFTITLPLTRRNWAMNMLLPGVLRRGTERYPDMASLNRRLDELYASCVELRSSKVGKNLSLVITAEMLDQRYVTDDTAVVDGVMEVIAELLLRPKLTEEGFDPQKTEQEKRFALDSLRAEINNTRSYAVLRLGELMYREDPEYPTLQATEEELKAIDSRSLAEFYRALLHSSPLEVFYVGSLSAEEIGDKLTRLFASWRGSSAHSLLLPKPEKSCGYRALTETMPVAQGKLAMGFRTGVCSDGLSNDGYVAMVLNELFGGSPASKLFMNVREKMSLCYYCSSAYSQYTGILTVSSGIETKNRAVAEEAILRQMEEIRLGNVSEAEFRAAKVSLENAYRQIYDNPFELQTFYGNRGLLGIPDTIEECRQKLADVRIEDVIRLAQGVECDTVFFIEGTLNDAQQQEDTDD